MPHLPNLATCKKIGFLVPSSNTAVEPITSAIFQSLNADIICIFTRIAVQTVGTDAKSTSQFSTEALVSAARLLADANCDVILWNGTSGMWVGTGVEADEALAKDVQDETGVPCSTTTLATLEALKVLGAKRISIAVPYTQALTEKLVQFFSGCGYEVVSTARLEKTPGSNIEIAKSSMKSIGDVIKQASIPHTDAVLVACTNWPASGIVEALEKDCNTPIVDSIIVTAWMGLKMVGLEPSISGWGRLMNMK